MRFKRVVRSYGDGALAIGLALLYLLESWASGPSGPGAWQGAASQPFAIVAGLVFIAALAWRTRSPLVVLALAFGTMALAWAGPQHAPNAFVLALLVAVYSVGAHTMRSEALIGALGVGALVIVAILEDPRAIQGYGDVEFLVLIIGGPWLAGRSIRLRREREQLLEERAVVLERDREEKIQAATAAERARIARDLHDVVAHSISIMVIQARGGRRSQVTHPHETSAALDAIESVGSQALTEMQRLLEVLRAEDEEADLAPKPTLRHVGVLAGQVSDAGLPVEVSVEGDPFDLPPGIELTAYRILQEALTNALKHAGRASARVAIRYAPDTLELEVVDTGRGARGQSHNGTGHGLSGMRERARLYGGQIEIGPEIGGGFAVRARFPIGTSPS